MREYYIFNPGRLRRKDNTLVFEKACGVVGEGKSQGHNEASEEQSASDETQRRAERMRLPVNDINSIYLFGSIDLNTKALDFLARHNISLHTFNYYGFYSGTYYPREYLNSGFLLVKQVEHYTNHKRRFEIARKFVEGSARNILICLRYYYNRGKDLGQIIDSVATLTSNVEHLNAINELRAIEGNIRKRHYEAFNSILSLEERFEKRVKRPPDNMINALISFGNSMLYTTVLSELYRTQLNPLIGYLHEPGERRFSLALDLGEIFKPIIVDRLIFKLLNKKMLQESDFDKQLNCCYLAESGRRTFVRAYDDRLKQTLFNKSLNREVSYRKLIRLEAYKLIKHLFGEREYSPYIAKW